MVASIAPLASIASFAFLALGFVALLALSSFLFYRFIFLRDPPRAIPSGNFIVSPADGKVIRIEPLNHQTTHLRKGFLGKIPVPDPGGKLISIFMSPFDVHFIRSPFQGVVSSVNHFSGKFFNAGDLQKSFFNEHTIIKLKTSLGIMWVIMIAGFLARRVHCFVKAGQKVNKGEKIGLISMGSQTSIIIPSPLNINVALGDRVAGGTSILATAGRRVK